MGSSIKNILCGMRLGKRCANVVKYRYPAQLSARTLLGPSYLHNSRRIVNDKVGKLLEEPVLFRGGMFSSGPLLIEGFRPNCKPVVTCYILCNQKILLLKRNNAKTASNTWCMPGGKLEQNETPIQAIMRETKEETGILLPPEQTDLKTTICVRLLVPKQDYLLHLFKSVLLKSESYGIVLNHEHSDYLWADPEEAKQLELMPGGREILGLELFKS